MNWSRVIHTMVLQHRHRLPEGAVPRLLCNNRHPLQEHAFELFGVSAALQ